MTEILQPTRKIAAVVYFHANSPEQFCPDGYMAALIAKRGLAGLDGEVLLIPSMYSRRTKAFAGRENVQYFFVDFSLKRADMIQFAGNLPDNCTVTVLDHHRTAEKELSGLGDSLPNVTVLFDMDRSGAMMAWEYFNPSDPPLIVQYIQDRDLWHKRLPGCEECYQSILSYPFDMDTWYSWIDDNSCIDRHIVEGKPIMRYIERRMSEIIPNARTAFIGGQEALVCNAPYFMSSNLANELAKRCPNDFGAVYTDYIDNRGWSLRSRSYTDVSEIAAKFGGGGHKHAAGFSTPLV